MRLEPGNRSKLPFCVAGRWERRRTTPERCLHLAATVSYDKMLATRSLVLDNYNQHKSPTGPTDNGALNMQMTVQQEIPDWSVFIGPPDV